MQTRTQKQKPKANPTMANNITPPTKPNTEKPKTFNIFSQPLSINSPNSVSPTKSYSKAASQPLPSPATSYLVPPLLTPNTKQCRPASSPVNNTKPSQTTTHLSATTQTEHQKTASQASQTQIQEQACEETQTMPVENCNIEAYTQTDLATLIDAVTQTDSKPTSGNQGTQTETVDTIFTPTVTTPDDLTQIGSTLAVEQLEKLENSVTSALKAENYSTIENKYVSLRRAYEMHLHHKEFYIACSDNGVFPNGLRAFVPCVAPGPTDRLVQEWRDILEKCSFDLLSTCIKHTTLTVEDLDKKLTAFEKICEVTTGKTKNEWNNIYSRIHKTMGEMREFLKTKRTSKLNKAIRRKKNNVVFPEPCLTLNTSVTNASNTRKTTTTTSQTRQNPPPHPNLTTQIQPLSTVSVSQLTNVSPTMTDPNANPVHPPKLTSTTSPTNTLTDPKANSAHPPKSASTIPPKNSCPPSKANVAPHKVTVPTNIHPPPRRPYNNPYNARHYNQQRYGPYNSNYQQRHETPTPTFNHYSNNRPTQPYYRYDRHYLPPPPTNYARRENFPPHMERFTSFPNSDRRFPDRQNPIYNSRPYFQPPYSNLHRRTLLPTPRLVPPTVDCETYPYRTQHCFPF